MGNFANKRDTPDIDVGPPKAEEFLAEQISGVSRLLAKLPMVFSQ